MNISISRVSLNSQDLCVVCGNVNYKNMIYYFLLVFTILTYSMCNVMPNWTFYDFYAASTTGFFRLPG